MDLADILSKTFLFSGIPQQTLDAILCDQRYVSAEFEKGELILSNRDKDSRLGFLISGECRVEIENESSDNVILNTLFPTDSFGILGVFCPDAEYPTCIFATKRSRVIYFTTDQITELVNKNPVIAMNVIRFLAKKVAFLNGKINTFSGKSINTKLSSYLSAIAKDGKTEIPFCGTRMANALGIGRASIYRSLEALSTAGLIELKNKKIYILDRIGLERMSK